MKFAMSYSCGKDSALALYRMVQQGHEPVALVVTVNEAQQRSWFHGVQQELLESVSDSMGIPLVLCRCKPEAYAESFEAGLLRAKEMGATACVFGDIDEPGHREWDEARCKAAGLDCVLPLWQQNRETLTREGIETGLKAIVKIVQLSSLDVSYLGRILDWELAKAIQAAGADMCGENGEYHTFVCDGPLFRYPVPIQRGCVVQLGTHAAVDIILKKDGRA